MILMIIIIEMIKVELIHIRPLSIPLCRLYGLKMRKYRTKLWKHVQNLKFNGDTAPTTASINLTREAAPP